MMISYLIIKKEMEKHIFVMNNAYTKFHSNENMLIIKEVVPMKTIKKVFVAGITIFALIAGSAAAFATSQYSTPAEAVAGLTGRQVQSIIDERVQTGKTYGTMADDAGVLNEFKAEMLEMKKDTLATRVAAGKITQDQADTIITKITSNQALCDGKGSGCGSHRSGYGAGAGFGQGWGNKDGRQAGHGHGFGPHDGSCRNR